MKWLALFSILVLGSAATTEGDADGLSPNGALGGIVGYSITIGDGDFEQATFLSYPDEGFIFHEAHIKVQNVWEDHFERTFSQVPGLVSHWDYHDQCGGEGEEATTYYAQSYHYAYGTWGDDEAYGSDTGSCPEIVE